MEDDREKNEWARHYDNLLWQVTGIMAVALGGLLAFIMKEDVNFQHKTVLVILGLFLTILAIYFAASFRELKHKYQTIKVLEETGGNRRYEQWLPYLFIFISLGLLYILIIWESCLLLGVIVLIIFIGYAFYFGVFVNESQKKVWIEKERKINLDDGKKEDQDQKYLDEAKDKVNKKISRNYWKFWIFVVVAIVVLVIIYFLSIQTWQDQWSLDKEVEWGIHAIP